MLTHRKICINNFINNEFIQFISIFGPLNQASGYEFDH
jgi:hypothetical protein